jgi:FMN reductase
MRNNHVAAIALSALPLKVPTHSEAAKDAFLGADKDNMDVTAKLVGLLGSVTPPGRSLRALAFAMDTARALEAGIECRLLNLADYRVSFADGRPPEQLGDDTGRLVAEVKAADGVLLASPVYRGSFSGVLKNFLDHLPVDALRDKPCGVLAIGATHHHYLGVDWHLRDVLAWFGALVAPVSVYLCADDFVAGEPSESAREQLRELVCSVLKLRVLSGERLGPPPLAARPR